MRLDTRDSTKHWDGEVGGGCSRNIFCKIDVGKVEGGGHENFIFYFPWGGCSKQQQQPSFCQQCACITQYFTRKHMKDRNTVRNNTAM